MNWFYCIVKPITTKLGYHFTLDLQRGMKDGTCLDLKLVKSAQTHFQKTVLEPLDEVLAACEYICSTDSPTFVDIAYYNEITTVLIMQHLDISNDYKSVS